ncbi:MAG: hypothetical protein LR015_07790 [Verrucomicrobia bacterium]|nr:hypothetical protein [Verrucomicrobiota bacterium]
MVIERKIRLDGTVVEVECIPVKVSHDFVVLRYDLPRAYEIDGVQLGVDCTTCACYWRGRPYNLYIFLRKEDSQPLGYYYNLIGESDWYNPSRASAQQVVLCSARLLRAVVFAR